MINVITPKKSFWQFPIALKFVVVWIFFLCFFDFWAAVDGLISARAIKVGSFIAGVVYFYLAIGLADRENTARILTSISVSIGTLVRMILLVLILLKEVDSGYIEYNLVKYPVSPDQAIAFLTLNIVFNIGILYTLLRPSTKALFAHPASFSAPQETQQDTSSSET